MVLPVQWWRYQDVDVQQLPCRFPSAPHLLNLWERGLRAAAAGTTRGVVVMMYPVENEHLFYSCENGTTDPERDMWRLCNMQ